MATCELSCTAPECQLSEILPGKSERELRVPRFYPILIDGFLYPFSVLSYNTSYMCTRKQMIQFTAGDGICILREMGITIAPSGMAPNCARLFAERTVGRLLSISGRTVRERVLHLVKMHMNGQKLLMKQ